MKLPFVTMIGASVVGVVMFMSSGAAQAQQACPTPGTVPFSGLAESRANIVPSQHRQLSSIGRLADNGGCAVVITCVTDPSLGEIASKTRDRQCAAARSAMVMFETRTKVRNELAKTYKLVKKAPGAGLAAGSVYVTLQ